jgi:DNA-directed RNA polymerase subunit RPC12/RpoP
MSSHPEGMPQKQVQIDISKADTITCDDCGNASFIQAFFLKKISALMSPTGKEAVVPMQVFSCGNCGKIPQNMIDQIGEQ